MGENNTPTALKGCGVKNFINRVELLPQKQKLDKKVGMLDLVNAMKQVATNAYMIYKLHKKTRPLQWCELALGIKHWFSTLTTFSISSKFQAGI